MMRLTKPLTYAGRPARRDIITAQTIDDAVRVQPELGVKRAAIYLMCAGVNLDIALRVLTRPGRRRAAISP